MKFTPSSRTSGPSDDLAALKALFDEVYYFERYPHVKASGRGGFEHYLNHGEAKDFQPRSDFDPAYYRLVNNNILEAASPFRHWVFIGRPRGLRGHPWIGDPSINDVALMREGFDADYYLSHNKDVAHSGLDPFHHFLTYGWREGRAPNGFFRIPDYLEMHPEVRETGVNPFSHYVVIGRAQGFKPAYPQIQDRQNTELPRFQYDVVEAEFDRDFYLTQLTTEAETPLDCVAHYFTEGAAKGLDPNDWFSTTGYFNNNEDVRAAGVNPFFHYLCQGRNEGRRYTKDAEPIAASVADTTLPAKNTAEMFAEHLAFTSPGPNFETLDPGILRSRTPRAKLLAYYLPQFHAIPENDAWWGLGFTEWRNIVRGQPRYRGHQQPRVPEQLGFYDLSDIRVIRKQVELARTAGVYGFCFYYYNFNGRRILEKPIESFLQESSIEFPFCLMWANENWTRTWDGLDSAVLLQQSYRVEDDAIFLADVARHFTDSRYVRIDGRPLFFIYRPGQISDAKERFKSWRKHWEDVHGVRPLIFMAQGFDDIDPRVYELDGAIEFPPHKICADMQSINSKLDLFDSAFSGHVISYTETIERSLREPPPSFPLIKTALPSWDNEARRPGRGMALHDAKPAHYEHWLRELVHFAEENPIHGESFVAVNAWNEWAEGAYIEPDAYHGAAYLNATARALSGAPTPADLHKHQLLIIGHDAYRHGAQILVRNLADIFRHQFGFEVHLGVCGDGPMLEEYRELANSCSTIRRRDLKDGRAFAQRLRTKGVRNAIINTTVAGWILPSLRDAGFRVTSLIHELPQLISEYKLESEATTIARLADTIVFPADLVQEGFTSIAGAIHGDVVTRAQGLYRRDIQPVSPKDRADIRAKLGLPAGARIVINVGYADMRKGFDIFLRIARAMCAKRHDVYFLWVGSSTPDAERWQMADIATSDFSDRVLLTGYTEEVTTYYAVADCFFLTSREDPFPSVVLEALAAGLPIVAARGACGTNGLVETYGYLVDINDDAGLIAAIEAAFTMPEEKRALGPVFTRECFSFEDYCFGLARLAYPNLPKVSVIVPNYNYAHYMEARLQSIFRQTHPVFEIIVLDDMSTDDSLKVISDVATRNRRKLKLVTSEENSGSVFHQWRRGIEMALGDYIWIAEADDVSEEIFLQLLLAPMIRDNANLGFTDSWQIGSHGERLGDSYKPYLTEELAGAFESSFSMEGDGFARNFLSVKNVILNVSGAVFKRQSMLDAMNSVGEDLFHYKIAGDWRLYVEMCVQPGAVVTYESQALNGHRRHNSSVTHSLSNKQHFSEIQDVQMHTEAKAGGLPPDLLVTRRIYLDKVAKYLDIDRSSGGSKNTPAPQDAVIEINANGCSRDDS